MRSLAHGETAPTRPGRPHGPWSPLRPMKLSRRAVLRTLAGLPLAATGRRSYARGPGTTPVAFGPTAPTTFPAPARVVLYGDSRGKIPLEFWREDTGEVPGLVVAQAVAERADL